MAWTDGLFIKHLAKQQQQLAAAAGLLNSGWKGGRLSRAALAEAGVQHTAAMKSTSPQQQQQGSAAGMPGSARKGPGRPPKQERLMAWTDKLFGKHFRGSRSSSEVLPQGWLRTTAGRG
jgi:hypothetical protein